MKSSILAAAVLSAAAFGLASCGDGATEQAVEAPEGVPGLTVTNARMVLAPVEGNPAAVYFDLAYDGDRNVALTRAHVEGAQSASLHEYGEWNRQVQMQEMLPLVLKKGDKVAFEPGGKHVMAMGVAPELQPGGKTEVTLTVSGGDKTTFEAEIRGPGEER
ncbi:copper chaperone PCu(A)C [Pelagerythrobacter aerophilus]|uniref:Copper chaperone PCu(A)C n=1 Tax=Pelagerythrobacter aerophilus TaxID=2306995 RepID=A0A418NJ52_9SPHN|nr:copper chaperone PCu(A)C [Pelagerythrobacter aerophilus]RIV79387.1 copper chaperone PCu(A)C [Pelagerythrobacter aerophilus]